MILVRALTGSNTKKQCVVQTNNKHLVCDELIKNYLFCTVYDTHDTDLNHDSLLLTV